MLPLKLMKILKGNNTFEYNNKQPKDHKMPKMVKNPSESRIQKYQPRVRDYDEGGKDEFRDKNYDNYHKYNKQADEYNESKKYTRGDQNGNNTHYRRAYIGQDYTEDDEVMEEEPINNHYEKSFKNSLKNNDNLIQKPSRVQENPQIGQYELRHSNSSGRLQYLKNIKPNKVNYNNELKARGSASSIVGATYFERARPVERDKYEISD